MQSSQFFEYELNSVKLRRALPETPGVYLFKDASGRVIYAGKAKNLKKRILSYFSKRARTGPAKTALMIERALRLEVVLTSTEQDALILESNFIKKHMPRYNVILRDDKQYPCLRFDIKERYPRLSIVRKIKKDGALYFGPFSSARAVRGTYKVIGRVFKLRKCGVRGMPRRLRPCLNFQMDRCLGPCAQGVSPNEYHQIVQRVKLFLEGRNQELIKQLKEDMFDLAGKHDFERAALIRDQITAIKKVVERQLMVSKKLEDHDFVGLSQDHNAYEIAIFFVRKGYVTGNRYYFFKEKETTAAEIMEAFLKQRYPASDFMPTRIFISHPVDGIQSMSEWFSGLVGKKVLIHRPLKGEKLRLVQMTVANAENQLKIALDADKKNVLTVARSVLGLNKDISSMEALDISNIQGSMAVGAVVSFIDGKPHKPGYRNYRIRNSDEVDDYAMMAELISRRISKGGLPDLFVVDGGKGHLSTVKNIMGEQGLSDGPEVISIAKPNERKGERHDKIYLPGRKNPLSLKPDHPVLLLVMQMRDEVHRRAIQYHRKLARKGMLASELDLVAGIGKKRKIALLQHFKDAGAVFRANIGELTTVPGISYSVAKNIISFSKKT
jgi:excinuclease ABC subunit C